MTRARTIVAIAVASATCALAQFPGDGGGPPGGGPPGGGRGGEMGRGPGGMGMMGDGVEQAKAALKASDEEWQVLRPAIQKVVNARRAAEAGLVNGQLRGGMFGGRGGRGGPGGMGNDSFNGPNNSGPGGRGGDRGGWGNRGAGGPPGEGGPDGPPPQGNNNDGPPAGQPPQQPGGQPRQQPGGNRQPSTVPAGVMGAGGPPGMMGPPAGPVGNAMNDLKAAAAKEGVKAEELNAKIAAVRAERKKAREALGAAVDELKALVTPEQEAMLIALGYLE